MSGSAENSLLELLRRVFEQQGRLGSSLKQLSKELEHHRLALYGKDEMGGLVGRFSGLERDVEQIKNTLRDQAALRRLMWQVVLAGVVELIVGVLLLALKLSA